MFQNISFLNVQHILDQIGIFLREVRHKKEGLTPLHILGKLKSETNKQTGSIMYVLMCQHVKCNDARIDHFIRYKWTRVQI